MQIVKPEEIVEVSGPVLALGLHPISEILVGSIKSCALNTVYVDSVVGMWFARLCGKRTVCRTPGPDIFRTWVSNKTLRQVVVGSKPENVDLFEGSNIAFVDPGWGDVEHLSRIEIIELVKSFNPELIWVALGCPKQEQWALRNASEFPGVPVVAIGAALKFYAGETPRASPYLRYVGLEWLFRLFAEPKLIAMRLSRSTFILITRVRLLVYLIATERKSCG